MFLGEGRNRTNKTEMFIGGFGVSLRGEVCRKRPHVSSAMIQETTKCQAGENFNRRGIVYCIFTALRCKSFIINGAGEGNRTFVSFPSGESQSPCGVLGLLPRHSTAPTVNGADRSDAAFGVRSNSYARRPNKIHLRGKTNAALATEQITGC